MTDMDLAAIDRELTRYRAAADAVSANLLELDADPNPQLLDTAPIPVSPAPRGPMRATR